MAAIPIADDSNFPKDITIVLVGCTGSGKSSTGNSILGRKAFQSSKSTFGRVTTVCMQQATVLQDGTILNVIDTPGLFDSSSKPELVQQEIVRCIEMAKDGIHAILLVVSLQVRFSEQQVAVVETLKHLFGARIVDYIIVAFTAADELEEDETLDDHLATCPMALKDLLEKCGNRRVVFDNKTKDEGTKAKQLQDLLTLISSIVVKNGGKPYTHELFVQLKNIEAAKRDSENSKQQMQKAYDEEQMQQHIAAMNEAAKRDSENSKQQMQKAIDEEQMQHRIAAMVEKKLKEKDEETINKLKQDLERGQREASESKKEQQEARNEIRKLREQLERITERQAVNRRSGACLQL